ncbi:adenosine deaminase [Lactococcus hircilactis]|uniref:Adenosine deaminase n=1 Tax=Lactococcus hircilactis TaxID=1494462 RepID=A0A7X2D0K3_9LACT|nr:adenosine deaminase [Lactococcus hircilactis]
MIDPKIIAKMPKVELHCHLDGSLSVQCIKQLAKNDQIWLPLTDAEILENAQAPETTKTLLEYLKRFDFVLPLLQSAQNLTYATFDVAQQASKDQVKYIEIRFAPMQHLKGNLTLEEAVEAVLEGCQSAQQQFDLKINLLICGLKQEKIAQLEKLPALFDHLPNEHLVGFDLAGDEFNYPMRIFEPLLKQITSRHVQLTLHAGECPHCSQNMRDSITFGATRLGHGVCARDFSSKELQHLIDQKIVLEMAPTSNFQTKAIETLEAYPFKKLYDAGVRVTLNTDNRTVSNTTLQKEYKKISTWYPDFKIKDFEQVNHYAIEGAFISPLEKENLHAQFKAAYKKISE